MAVSSTVTLADILLAIDKLLPVLNGIKSVVSNVDNVIGSSNNNSTEDIVIGISNINAQLVDTNIRLGNIQTILQIMLELAIVVIVFKGLYFILDKVFFQ